MNKLRVFLAEDQTILRHGLRALIANQPDMEVVGEAGDGESAVQQVKQLKPDLVVMDVSMPKLDGVQATEMLQRDCPQVKVLALTVHESKSYLRRLIKAGATGYVVKRSAADSLIRAIRVIATEGVYLDPIMAGKLAGAPAGQSPTNTAADDTLTGREAEVLRLVAWGYANKEIAAKLDISVKTVETHKTNLMERLHLHSRVDIVREAVRRGWLKDAPPR